MKHKKKDPQTDNFCAATEKIQKNTAKFPGIMYTEYLPLAFQATVIAAQVLCCKICDISVQLSNTGITYKLF